jgi:hypothetical protein
MQLQFNEDLHQYTLDGKIIPSVTKILSPLNDFSGIPMDVLERKRMLGTALHKCIDLYLLDDLDTSTIHEDVAPYFNGFLKFMTETGFQVEQSESRVFSKSLRYAGTFDLIGKLNDSRVLIDTKSVAVLGKSVGPQLAAYEHAHHELNPDLKIKKRFALQLKPDGSYKLPEYKNRQDFEIFKSCLNIYNWKNS